ncbi:MAG: VC0807 family protein [Thermomicrobiales bacterium]
MVKPLFTIVIPIIILLTLSDESRLGPIPALLLSLAFPLSLGIWELARSRRVDIFATVGVISVVLTGVIGFFALSPRWLAVKEATVPLVFALFIIGSDYKGWPLVQMLFDRTLRRDRVRDALEANGTAPGYRQLISKTSWLWAGTMAASGVFRYVLAIVIVTSEPGTKEFNRQLGEMTALRIPLVSVPVGIMMVAMIWFMVRSTSRLTQLPASDIFKWADRIPKFRFGRRKHSGLPL